MDPFQNMPTPTAPEPEVEARMASLSAYTAIGDAVTDRRNDTTVFASTHEAGSSAIYTRDGGTVYLKDPEIHGWGEMTPQDLRNELGSKYGFCAAVLSNQKTSHVTLVNPKIVCHESSTANGAYAIFGGAVVIEGGTIDTCNRQGHGVDASYGGHIYCNGTKIHTGGMNSGALATDFQGGYITVRDIEAVTEIPGSPGIYTAGKSIITAYNSKFVSKGCEAVMVAHSLGHTYLYDCDLTGTVGLNTHNSMSPEYSYVHMFGGTLNSTAGSILCAEDGGRRESGLRQGRRPAGGQSGGYGCDRQRRPGGDILSGDQPEGHEALRRCERHRPVCGQRIDLDRYRRQPDRGAGSGGHRLRPRARHGDLRRSGGGDRSSGGGKRDLPAGSLDCRRLSAENDDAASR